MPDLDVMGAGVFGLAVAYAAARRGARVRVIDPGGTAAGASGGLVGALAPHVPEAWNGKKQFQLDCLLMAADWWAGVAAVSARDPGYARSGRLQPLGDEPAVAQAEARAAGAAEIWGARATWRLRPVQDFAPLAPVSATGLVVHDTLSARLHPRRACAALAAAVAALGGEILADPAAGPAAGPVVWATGVAGLADLSAALGVEAGRGEKGQALTLACDGAAAPQIYAGGLHVVPHADGTVAVGSTSERDYDDPGRVDAGRIADLHRRAVVACPWLAGAPVVATWAGVRPRAATRAPLLGAWPGRPGHFIANGGFKIGFGLAPGVGEAMAALVLEGQDTIPPEFRPDALPGVQP